MVGRFVTSSAIAAQFTRRRVRLGSGLVLFAYVASHLANHAAGLISLDAAEAARLAYLAFWRSLPATVVLYTAFALHVGLALAALYERHSLRMPRDELARLALGDDEIDRMDLNQRAKTFADELTARTSDHVSNKQDVHGRGSVASATGIR